MWSRSVTVRSSILLTAYEARPNKCFTHPLQESRPSRSATGSEVDGWVDVATIAGRSRKKLTRIDRMLTMFSLCPCLLSDDVSRVSRPFQYTQRLHLDNLFRLLIIQVILSLARMETSTESCQMEDTLSTPLSTSPPSPRSPKKSTPLWPPLSCVPVSPSLLVVKLVLSDRGA